MLEGATSYFAPAYGAPCRPSSTAANVQQANALVQATAQALSIGGWALAALLLAFLPVSTFFAVDAATFLVSAALIVRPAEPAAAGPPTASPPRLREGIAALGRDAPLVAAVVVVRRSR